MKLKVGFHITTIIIEVLNEKESFSFNSDVTQMNVYSKKIVTSLLPSQKTITLPNQIIITLPNQVTITLLNHIDLTSKVKEQI